MKKILPLVGYTLAFTLTLFISTLTIPKDNEVLWYLLPLACLFLFVSSLFSVSKQEVIKFNFCDLIMISLSVSILIADWIKGLAATDNFRLISIQTGFIVYWICRIWFSNKLLWSIMLLVLATIAYQSIVSIYQIITSDITKFYVRGLFLHSGYNAQSISLGAPIILSFILASTKSRVHRWMLGTIATGLPLFLTIYLESRIATLSVIVGVAVVLLPKLSLKKKILSFSILLLLIASSALVFKLQSSSGRILIWTVTLDHLTDYFPFGTGTSTFSSLFFNWQAEYFSNHQNSKFLLNADDIQYPFNEWLLWTIEYGILWIALFLSCILRAISTNIHGLPFIKAVQAIFTILMLQSLVSNIFQTSFFYFLFFSCLGCLSSGLSPILTLRGQSLTNLVRNTIAITSSAFFLYFSWFVFNYSIGLQKWQDQTKMSKSDFQKLNGVIGSHPGFSYKYALFLFNKEEFQSSLSIVNNSHPNSHFDINILKGLNYMSLNSCDSAILQFTKCSNYIPHRLYPVYLIMSTEKRCGHLLSAHKYAQKIINMKPKVQSVLTDAFKREAKALMNELSK